MIKYKVEFFEPREFVCKCCGTGRVASSLVYTLDMIRRAWDGAIIVTNGYRCEKHNREVGGATMSRHMIGCAADIKPLDPALIGPFQYLLQHLTARRDGWELKLYPTFVHIGVPRVESASLWSGGQININIK